MAQKYLDLKKFYFTLIKIKFQFIKTPYEHAIHAKLSLSKKYVSEQEEEEKYFNIHCNMFIGGLVFVVKSFKLLKLSLGLLIFHSRLFTYMCYKNYNNEMKKK